MRTETNVDVSPTRYFWLQLAALGAGLGVLYLAYPISQQLDDSNAGATFSTIAVMLAVSTALAAVGRAVYVIVTSASSDAHRVFRTRHLVVCVTLLFVVAAGTTAVLVARGPFEKLLARGRITGVDVTDGATAIAAVVCMVGAGVAAIGAWDALHEQRNWHRTLHVPGRRPT